MSDTKSKKKIKLKDKIKIDLQYESEQLDQPQQQQNFKIFLTNNSKINMLLDQNISFYKEKILDRDIYFPNKPYVVQVEYMKSVLEALDNNQNALQKKNILNLLFRLQSPTGTGKTLSLLCSALGWLEDQRNKAFLRNLNVKTNEEPDQFYKIIYASRTHSQIKQVMNELKKTVYRPKISLLGSREKMCIKSEYQNLSGPLLNLACQKSKESCNYFNKDKLKEAACSSGNEIMDIEELIKYGKKETLCPYYHEKNRFEQADLIFMPYNYLLQKQIVKKIDIRNAILIFDEAHNTPNCAEEGYSFGITEEQLEEAIKELNNWIVHVQNDKTASDQIRKTHGVDLCFPFTTTQDEDKQDIKKSRLDIYNDICLTMSEFKKFMEKNRTEVLILQKDEIQVYEGDKIFEMLTKNTKITQKQLFTQNQFFFSNINKDNINSYRDYCWQIEEFMKDYNQCFHFQRWIEFIENIQFLISKDKYAQEQNLHWLKNPINSFKLLSEIDKESKHKSLKLHMLCLDAGLAFQRLLQKECSSIILTSGTLTPFDSWDQELRIEFSIKLDNKHVIDTQNNINAGVVSLGDRGNKFEFVFNNRDNVEMFLDLGYSFLKLFKMIPNGILVVFPSFGFMNKCKKYWTNSKLLTQINNLKELFWEPDSNKSLDDCFQFYKINAFTPKGAVFFAVARGKVSEGIDFTDELCRAVFIVGIPFPSQFDQKIILKKKFIQRQQEDRFLNMFNLTPSQWYYHQAIRATNQAVGRVIRHINDWGYIKKKQINFRAIYFVDNRFSFSNNNKELPNWISTSLKKWKSFHEALKDSEQFFNRKLNKQSQCPIDSDEELFELIASLPRNKKQQL